jgi:hypothetical protein
VFLSVFEPVGQFSRNLVSRYIIGCPSHVIFSFLQSLITAWGMHELEVEAMVAALNLEY